MSLKDEVLQRLDDLIGLGQELTDSFQLGEMGSSYSDEPEARFRAFVTGAFAAISSVAGEKSEYYKTIPRKRLDSALSVAGYDASFIPAVLGALQSLRDAVDAGYLASLESRIRANVHDDLLTQAKELLHAGYHIAAMVLAGAVLEDHLCKLALARMIKWSGSGSISKYNDALRDVLYPQPVWRRIQSIADVRNEAAHGNTATVKVDDVRDATSFIWRILSDYPS